MMHSVTKATNIQFINGKCHIKKRKGCKTPLSGYYVYLSCDLLLMLSGAGHKRRPMFVDKMTSRNHTVVLCLAWTNVKSN